MKKCTKCRTVKALTEFYRRTINKDGYNATCKACVRAYHQTPEYKEHRHAYLHTYRQTLKYKEYLHTYRQTPEYQERLRCVSLSLSYKEQRRIYSQTPNAKECSRAHVRRQRMHRLKARPPWVNGTEIEATINSIYSKRDALKLQTGQQHDVDHFFPLKNKDFSGLDVPWNLRVLTHEEHKPKINKRPELFYSPREFNCILRQLNR